PTGGESFNMKGGVVVNSTQVSASLTTCAPPPSVPLMWGLVPPLNASPLPKISWRAASCIKGHPADAQIAVSSTRVVVTFENSLGWYDKNGNKQGELTNLGLFKPLLAQLAQSVGMANDSSDCYYSEPYQSCARTQ